MGFSPNDRFELVSAHQDELGWTHARLQQTFQGIPVRGARLIAHLRPDGTFAPYSDAGLRGIDTSPVPRISTEDAVKLAEGDPRHRYPWAVPPRTELSFFPTWRTQLLRGGGPVPPTRYDPSAALAMYESIGAEDVVRVVDRVFLAWKVTGIEYDAASGDYLSRVWWVDSDAGRVLGGWDLTPAATGTGTGFWSGTVSFSTDADNNCFHMYDADREFTTETEDFGSDHAVNCDANNVWGNGLAFEGNASASNANWQTAMVDGHFGATVYWDLMDNVFNLQGPDDDFYSVNVFMHHGTLWNNARYNSLSGNVVFGDGTNGVNRTRLDCLGHELGHAWNDHNTGFDGDADALNESLADVFGEWTDAYLASGGFANHSSTIGGISHADWINRCSGRNLVNPGSNGNPAFWYADILDGEEHRNSAPASRAFAFLARGSSSWHRDANYSRKVPWGMAGLGLRNAARVYYRAHRDWIDDHDYAGVRAGMIDAADQILNDTAAVRNAYAAINVGNAAAGMPTAPPTTPEVEPNGSQSSAQSLGWGTSPPGGAILPAPRKLKVSGGGTGSDWYKVTLTGNLLSVLLTPTFSSTGGLGVYGVEIRDVNGAVEAEASAAVIPQRIEHSRFVDGSAYNLWIRVFAAPGTSSNATYTLDIDLKIN
jgi:Zn-dependent metalloprotease